MQSPAKQKAMETYKKFSEFWRRLSTEQVLFQYQLGEPELVALSASPTKLIFKLYEHPSIARRADTQGSLLDALPGKNISVTYCKTPMIRLLEIFALFASSKKTQKLQAHEKWEVSYIYQSV